MKNKNSWRFTRLLPLLVMLFSIGIGNVWGELTAHEPGIYEKAVNQGGYGISLTNYNGSQYEVYYFSANSKYGSTCTGATKAQYRLMCADNQSEHLLFANANAGTSDPIGYSESCDWISTNLATSGFAKSDYTYGTTTYDEFFAVTPNGGNSGYTKTCMLKSKNGDEIHLKVKGYTEFALLASDNSSSKYITVTIDGGDAQSTKSSTLSRRAYTLTDNVEHTIDIALVGTSQSCIYGFSLKLPTSGTQSNITYENLKGATNPSSNPAKYTEGVGVSSFAALPNVEGFIFNSWNPSSIPTTATGDQTITAVWDEDPRCAYMPTITSQPSSLDKISVSGITLTNAGSSNVGMDAKGIKLGSNAAWLKVSLSNGSIEEGTKIEIKSKGGTSTGISIHNGNMKYKVLDATGLSGDNTQSHTFTAAEAANYGDEFIISRDSTGASNYVYEINVYNCGGALVAHGVTYDANGGSGSMADVNTYKKLATVTILDNAFEAPSSQEFDKWVVTDASNNVIEVTGGKFTMPNSAVTIKATWKPLSTKYTVTYAAGCEDYSGDLPTETDKAEGDQFNLANVNVITREGYTQSHWAYTPDGGSVQYLNGGAQFTMPTANVTFVAYWKPTYAVTLDANGGSANGSATAVYGSKKLLDNSFTAATFTGATCNGYFTTADNQGVLVIDKDGNLSTTAVDGYIDANGNWIKQAACTLYAHWTINYASSVDIEKYVVDDDNVTLADVKTKLDAANISYTNLSAIDRGHTHNNIYDGVKWSSSNNGDLSFIAEPGKLFTLRVGYMKSNTASKMYVNGVEDAMVIASANESTEKFHNYYWYNDDATSYQLKVNSKDAGGTCVVKAVLVEDPYTVKFNVGEGGTSIPDATFKGEGLTLPTAESGSKIFDGWFVDDQFATAVTLVDGKFYPSASCTIYAKFLEKQNKTGLESLKYGDDVTSATAIVLVPGQTEYSVELPVGTVTAPTVFATVPVADKSTLGEITQATDPNGSATFTVTAEDGNTKANYTVNFSVAAKEGTSIIKAELTSTSKANYSGLYDDETNSVISLGKADDGASGYKFSGEGKYIKLAVTGTKFQAGDVLKLTVSAAATQGTLSVYSDQGTTEIAQTAYSNTSIELPTGTDLDAIYVCRTSSNKYNAHITAAEVTREINTPVIKSLKINDVAGEFSGSNITVSLPYGTDKTALTPVVEAYANGGATVNPVGAQNFTNAVEYTVTSKYNEEAKYMVAVAVDAPSADATLKSLKYDAVDVPNFDAATYTYAVNLPYGTTDVPALSAEVNESHATTLITNADAFDADGKASSTVAVTAQDGSTKLTYTVNFQVAQNQSVVIFDGSTMQDMATSPSGSISWAIVGSTMTAGDKNVSYGGKSYTRALSLGSTSTTKHFTITVGENTNVKISVIGMSNSSSDTRHAWLTASADKGEYTNAIDYLTSTGYNPAEFTTDWLEEGTYYLHADNTVPVFLVSVEYKTVAPKAAAPEITDESGSQTVCASATTFDELSVTASPATAYQWYKKADAGDDVAVGTNATYTPTADGTYYCVVTNQPANTRANSIKSSEMVMAHAAALAFTTQPADALNKRQGAVVSFSAAAEGGVGAISYAWYACDENGVISGSAISTDATCDVTLPSAAFGTLYYKAVATNSTCSEEVSSQVAKVTEYASVTLQPVTAYYTWDWANITATADVAATNGEVMANLEGINNDENFKSDEVYAKGAYAYRKDGKYFQGYQIQLHTNIPGYMTVYYRGTGKDKKVKLTVNNTELEETDGDFHASKAFYVDGDVVLDFLGESNSAARVNKIVFSGLAQIGENNYGTLADAFAIVKADETIKLMTDVTLDARVDAAVAAAYTVDLNGHTITPTRTCGNGSAFNVKAGTVTFKNGTIDGTALTQTVADGYNNECDAITVRSGAVANLTDGLTIKVNNITGSCAYAFDGGKINVTGGKYSNASTVTGPDHEYAMCLNQANVATQLIEITGGDFTGSDPKLGDNNANGCTTFCAKMYSTQDNGDGSFSAIKGYSLKVTDAGVATLVLPYETTIPSGVNVYTLSGVDAGTALATEVTSKLPANTPVYIEAAGGNYTFSPVKNAVYNENLPTDGLLRGVYAKKTFANYEANTYILSNGSKGVGFYLVSTGNYVNANRCYMVYGAAAGNAGAGAGAGAGGNAPQHIQIIFPGQPGFVTGLDALNAEGENLKFFQNGKLLIRHNGVLYDAAGMKVK